MVNHFTNTPEALVGRSDSKNPSSTCKGITSSGRPCRRALASVKDSPTGKRRSSIGGVVAVVEEDGAVTEADFFCWQHKDQAADLVQQEQNAKPPGRKNRKTTELFPLQERSSIDTLVQRLGIEAVPQRTKKDTSRPNGGVVPSRTETTDFARPTSNAPHAGKYSSHPADPPRPVPSPKRAGFWSSLCCIGSQDDEYVELVRRRKHDTQAQGAHPPTAQQTSVSPTNLKPTTKPQRRSSSNPQTDQLLSLLPTHLSPPTISTLLAELIKPISAADEEGYIYIFWLTPQSQAAPEESTARSLLTPPSASQGRARRISDVMTEYSHDASGGSSRSMGGGNQKKTIMLKIGRANNVTRRMNEWQRQCGYALNLVRWYPYVPSSAAPSPQPSPVRSSATARRESGGMKKVQYVKRVERLVHLELAEKQVKKHCTACGKEHREWFEVEASQQGIKEVDACVRRWVDWAEREAKR